MGSGSRNRHGDERDRGGIGMSARLFYLERHEDVSGVSGTGTVADGVEFDDGTVVIHWRGDDRSTVVWASIEAAERVHGHDGKTSFVWES